MQAVPFSSDDKRLLTGGRDKPMIGEFLQNFFGDSYVNKGVSARLWDVNSGADKVDGEYQQKRSEFG